MALARLVWCLRHTVLFGTVTNVNYLQDVLLHPKVRAGKMHVKLLETELQNWTDQPPEALLSAHADLLAASSTVAGAASGSAKQKHPSPWETKA